MEFMRIAREELDSIEIKLDIQRLSRLLIWNGTPTERNSFHLHAFCGSRMVIQFIWHIFDLNIMQQLNAK
jgi:hypothetical protein